MEDDKQPHNIVNDELDDKSEFINDLKTLSNEELNILIGTHIIIWGEGIFSEAREIVDAQKKSSAMGT